MKGEVIKLSKPSSPKSHPFLANKFSPYFYEYFDKILLNFWLSWTRLVSSILHHFDCNAHTKELKYALETKEWSFQKWIIHYWKFTSHFCFKVPKNKIVPYINFKLEYTSITYPWCKKGKGTNLRSRCKKYKFLIHGILRKSDFFFLRNQVSPDLTDAWKSNIDRTWLF